MDRVQYEALVIQDLVNLHKEGKLNLSPWYQRRSVWNKNQKSYLINTLHEKKPIPALYIRHSLDLEKERSIKELVDGQQRTRAILEYFDNEYSSSHPRYEKKVFFKDLKKSDKESFLLTSIPVGYLLGATDQDVIDIFARINSVSKTLKTQEKLNAEFSGEFKQFCVTQAVSRLSFWRDYNIFSAVRIERMEEVNFISDVTISYLDGLTDSSAVKTKKYYKEYDDEFQDALDISNRLDEVFDLLVSIDISAIKETIFSRPPILFSLFVVIDELQTVDEQVLEEALFEIDARFNTEEDIRNKEDNAFVTACLSSTPRQTQRNERHKYIKSFLAK